MHPGARQIAQDFLSRQSAERRQPLQRDHTPPIAINSPGKEPVGGRGLLHDYA